jgi:hypothetical protein
MISSKYCFTILIYFSILKSLLVEANSDHDGGCCRRAIACFDCDSRFDPRCGDTFNMTSENGPIKMCNDLCYKLKHKVGDKYYYIRSCADTLKKIYIKKTDVCYLTRTKDSGNLCFCDTEHCNSANNNKNNFFTFYMRLNDHHNRHTFYFAIFSYGLKLCLQLFFVALCSSTFYFNELVF